MQLQLDLPGVQWLPDRLIIGRDLESDELNSSLCRVVSCHNAATWWSGDLLAYIHEHRGEPAAREAARQFRDPVEIWDAMRVCESLSGNRVENVGYKHHRAALDECRGDGKAALSWILRARDENWEISELRANIRRALSASPVEQKTSRQLTITSEIRRFSEALRELVARRPISTWTPEECKAFLADCVPIIKILNDVRGALVSAISCAHGDK